MGRQAACGLCWQESCATHCPCPLDTPSSTAMWQTLSGQSVCGARQQPHPSCQTCCLLYPSAWCPVIKCYRSDKCMLLLKHAALQQEYVQAMPAKARLYMLRLDGVNAGGICFGKHSIQTQLKWDPKTAVMSMPWVEARQGRQLERSAGMLFVCETGQLTCKLVKKQNCAAVAMRTDLSPMGLCSSCATSCSKSASEIACACTMTHT